jgi:hypothetical protein
MEQLMVRIWINHDTHQIKLEEVTQVSPSLTTPAWTSLWAEDPMELLGKVLSEYTPLADELRLKCARAIIT